jgi:hypothetical protein
VKRPRSLDSTLLISDLRGDRFPPTNSGIARAVLELVDEVETAVAATTGPMRAIIWVTLNQPPWAWLMFGYWRHRVIMKVRRVVNAYGATEVDFQIKVI